MGLFGSRKPEGTPPQQPPATQQPPPPAAPPPLTRLPARPAPMPEGAPHSGEETVPATMPPTSAGALRPAPRPASSVITTASVTEVAGIPVRALPATAPRPQAPGAAQKPLDLRAFLAEAVRMGASDLHLTRNMPPMVRMDGYLAPLDYPALSQETLTRMILAALTPEQRSRFDTEWELDLSMELPDTGRFRVNIHRQRGSVEGAFRVVNDVILPVRKLGLPPVVEELARKHSGLVIVTGPTGSGKTTSLAAIIDQINHERQCMIVTIEDPIEYIHRNHRAIVKQREVTSDTLTFARALRHVLRQDPDVIVIGEMRDLETITTALTAAETGHMVFTTLHTPDAIQTIDRVIDVFPPHQQDQTRIQLANTLQGVVAQQLIPVPGNRGRALACEVLIATTAVRKIVRSAKTEQLMTVIQTSADVGMVSMDKSLKELYLQGLVSYDDAISRCRNPENFDNV